MSFFNPYKHIIHSLFLSLSLSLFLTYNRPTKTKMHTHILPHTQVQNETNARICIHKHTWTNTHADTYLQPQTHKQTYKHTHDACIYYYKPYIINSPDLLMRNEKMSEQFKKSLCGPSFHHFKCNAILVQLQCHDQLNARYGMRYE